jgi:hypothetical protein
MAYTKEQITAIHVNSLAKEGKRYVSGKDVYEGMYNGRLRLLENNTTKTERTTKKNTGDISDIQEDIVALKEKDIELEKEIEEAKCFAIAMSMIL